MIRRIAAAAAVVLALGCGDSTAPQDAFSGFYLLVSVDGVNVPTTVSGNDLIPAFQMATDTLLLEATGYFDDEPIPQTGQRIGLQGTWTFRGDSAYFYESSVGALAARAKLTGTSLAMRTLETHLFPNHDFVYSKLQ